MRIIHIFRFSIIFVQEGNNEMANMLIFHDWKANLFLIDSRRLFLHECNDEQKTFYKTNKEPISAESAKDFVGKIFCN